MQTIYDITNITIVRNAYLENPYRRCDLIMVYDNYETAIMLNITEGVEYLLGAAEEAYPDKQTKEEVLYTLNPYDDYEYFEFGETVKVTRYKNATLINTFNGYPIIKSDFLEFKDDNDNTFYLDYRNNEISCRNGYIGIEKNDKTQVKTIFEKGKKCILKRNDFKNIKSDILNKFLNFFTEEI